MADHIATAQRYRARAAKCELSAKATSSEKFGECYRLLAQHYRVLANLEEDCANLLSPFARQDPKQGQKQDPKQDHKQDSKLGNKSANEERNSKPAEQAPVRSVAVVGVSVFGEREDMAAARVEFDDGSVADVAASRASDQAVRRMRIWGERGHATLDFAARHGITPQTEHFPMSRINEAFERLGAGKARYRIVLDADF